MGPQVIFISLLLPLSSLLHCRSLFPLLLGSPSRALVGADSRDDPVWADDWRWRLLHMELGHGAGHLARGHGVGVQLMFAEIGEAQASVETAGGA